MLTSNELTQEEIDNLEGRIHSIETGGAVDGPGLRYIIFLQGCQFKCIYCHNRDTWDFKSGQIITIKKLMDEIQTYAPFFHATNGGVTCSGGEATLQPKFVKYLFKEVHKAGFNTCLDTNGGIRVYNDEIMGLIEETDTFLLDIKAMDDEVHKKLTGVSNENTLNFAKFLKKYNKKIWVRLVVVPTYTDTEENAHALGKFVQDLGDCVEKIELLPYHELGKHKWKFFEEEYKLEGIKPPSKETMLKIKNILLQYHKVVQ